MVVGDELRANLPAVTRLKQMEVDAYRLWQQWQQMHYPQRGLPDDEGGRTRLVTIDGVAGTALDAYFCRGSRTKTLDAETLATLSRCRADLDPHTLAADASRYFGRLHELIEWVLADARPGETAAPASHRRQAS